MKDKDKIQKLERISATEMQAKSGQILKKVYRGTHILVERGGFPVAVIVPLTWYEQLIKDNAS